MSFQDVRILSRGGGGGAITTPPPLASSSPTWKRRQLAAQARSVRVAALSGTQSENVERRDPPRPPPPPQRSSRPFVLHGKVQKGWSMNSSSGSVLDEEYEDDDDDDGDDDDNNNKNDNDDETLEETGDKSYAPSPHHSRHQSSRKVDAQTRQMNKAHQEMRSVLQLQKRRDFVRKSQQRKSVYAVLQNETQQFQALVTELESALQSSGESPEQAWRARILMRTAQDSDHDLWKRLYCYEQTLMVRSITTTTTPAPAAAGGGTDGVPQHRAMSLGDGNQVDDDNDDDNNNDDEEKEEIEVRAAQTACLKLHRDFKRSHRALMMLLTTHEQRQRAEISTLGAVGWSGDFSSKQQLQQQQQQHQQQEHHDMAWAHDEQQRQQEEDFFDRAMRERQAEVDHIHSSMIKVNEIYRDLATLVNHQQDDIDQLDDDIVDAKENVERGYNESSCMSNSRDRFCGVMDHLSPDDNSWTDWPLIGLSATTRSTTEEATTTTATANNNNTSMKRSNPADEGWALPTPEMRISETFHWLMPFETLTEDIKLVKLDIVALGQDIVNKGQNKLQCKPSTYDDDDDTEVDEENDDEQDDSIQT